MLITYMSGHREQRDTPLPRLGRIRKPVGISAPELGREERVSIHVI